MGDQGRPGWTVVTSEDVAPTAALAYKPIGLSARVRPLRPRLADLFAPIANPRPVTPRAILGAVAAVAVATVVCLLRIRGVNGAGPLNVLWAEDASNFLTDGYLHHPLDNLFTPINGYHLFYGRILSEFASFFPVAWGAGVLIASSAASSAVMGFIVYVASGQLLRHPLPRAIAGISIIVTPVAYGMANQVAPLHFAMLYTAFWCLYVDAGFPSGRSGPDDGPPAHCHELHPRRVLVALGGATNLGVLEPLLGPDWRRVAPRPCVAGVFTPERSRQPGRYLHTEN